MSKILVTGVGGFIIGSHLTEYLVENGHKVKGEYYVNIYNCGNWNQP
ncbi:hypothetical protein ES708_23196 [subsurface metagenome]